MNRRLASLAIVAALGTLALPAVASAKVFHFKGKAAGTKPTRGLVITFDVTGSKGRATKISNVYVQGAEFGCRNGFHTTRSVRFFESAKIAKNGRFNLRETQLPPGADNWFQGKITYPRTVKGKRTPLQVKGDFSSEFGYGLRRSDYNCIAGDDIVAKVG
jgi:hypothetical protein